MFTTIALAMLLASEPKVHRVRNLEVETLTVRTEGSSAVLNVSSSDQGVGLWLHDGKGGPMVTLYASPTQTYIGLQKVGKGFVGDQLAFSLDGEKPIVQYKAAGGEIKIIPFEDLVKPVALKAHKPTAKKKACPCAKGGKCTCKGKCPCKNCRCKKCPAKKKPILCPCCPGGRCR